MLAVQLLRHLPQVPAAPYTYSTVVSSRLLSRDEVPAFAVRLNLPVVDNVQDYWLEFRAPALSPRDGLRNIEGLHRGCAKCHLSANRTQMAFFRGNPDAAVLVVGESPGRTEDSTGEPFTGASGRLQSEMFREVGIDPDRDIAWTNLCACRACTHRTSEDRYPSMVERIACSERFYLTLCAIRPRVVLCLGKHPTSVFWPESPRNNTWIKLATPQGGTITVGVMRHPAYVLRGMMTRNYKEYFTAKLMLKKLALNLPRLQKIDVWPFLPLYASDVVTKTLTLIGGQDGTCA